MPELPEIEALRRQLDGPVSAFPVVRAGPAHIATLKTFDPPLSTLEGRLLAGAERRGKNLLFPTADGELVLRIHLMSAGRIRYLLAGEKGPKTPAFNLTFTGGGRLRPHGGRRKEARGRLARDAGGGGRRARAPGPGRAGPRPRAARRDPARGVTAPAPAAARPAGARRHRPRVVERDPPHCAAVAVRALHAALRRGDRAALGRNRRGADPRSGPARVGRRQPEDVPRPRPPRRAVPCLRHPDRPRATSRSTRSTTAPRARPEAAS